jgi:hypothetical protein
MKTSIPIACLMIALLAGASISSAQTNRYVLMESNEPSEYGWSINRPSKIGSEAEGRVLALEAVNGAIENMANISNFEAFSKTEVKNKISDTYEQIGEAFKNTFTATTEDRSDNAFKANKRGLVITVKENGFKPGTFSSSSDYNKLSGVRKSKASGILLYTFKVYAPENYNPKPENYNPKPDSPIPTSPNLEAQQKIISFYRDFLSREPRPDEIDFRMDAFRKGYPLEKQRTDIAFSDEVRQKIISFYKQYIGRTPMSRVVEFRMNALLNGRTLEQQRTDIEFSDEARQKIK